MNTEYVRSEKIRTAIAQGDQDKARELQQSLDNLERAARDYRAGRISNEEFLSIRREHESFVNRA